jgi:hypothetical protein
MPAGLQHRQREVGGDFAQMHGAHVVGAAVAGGRRGHVGQHDVGRSAQRLEQLLRRVRRRENPAWRIVTPGIGSTRDSRSPTTAGFASVEPSFAPQTWHQPPGAAPRSTIAHAGLQDLVACRRSPSACRRRASDSPRPWSAAHRDRSCGARASAATIPSAALLLDLGAQHARRPPPSPGFFTAMACAPDARRHHRRHQFLNMPSRRPRSATRSRSDGHTRRIASRMAQPASTRSARSAPMQGLATRARNPSRAACSTWRRHRRWSSTARRRGGGRIFRGRDDTPASVVTVPDVPSRWKAAPAPVRRACRGLRTGRACR